MSMDFANSTSYDTLVEKWNPLLNHEALPEIQDSYRKKVTAQLLENQEKSLREQYLIETPTNFMGGNPATGQVGAASTGIAGYDPILISLVRRSMPNLMAYDLAGVQPMSAPTGLIFAMRSRYTAQGTRGQVKGDPNGASGEALFQEPWAIAPSATSFPYFDIRSSIFLILSLSKFFKGFKLPENSFNKCFNSFFLNLIEELCVEIEFKKVELILISLRSLQKVLYLLLLVLCETFFVFLCDILLYGVLLKYHYPKSILFLP